MRASALSSPSPAPRLRFPSAGAFSSFTRAAVPVSYQTGFLPPCSRHNEMPLIVGAPFSAPQPGRAYPDLDAHGSKIIAHAALVKSDPPTVSNPANQETLSLGACLDNSGLWWRRLLESDSLLMSKTFRPWTIDQPLLLPPSVQDFVGEDHLARFILALGRCQSNGG